jgi:hypothetical protein
VTFRPPSKRQLTRFERSSIRDFVPLLVERRATAQLSKNGLPAAVERQPVIM